MSEQQLERPPSYTADLSSLPSPPTTLNPSPQLVRELRHQSHPTEASPSASQASLATVQPLALPSAPSHLPGTTASPPETNRSNVSHARSASTSMADPDDRMAAEALCGLGKTDTSRVASGYDTPLKYYPMNIEHTQPGSSPQQLPEPLLSLLTSAHPWLGGTLNGSLSAYSSTKSFSPRIVQYGADLVENTVNTVGRVSGVEGSIRRYLESRDDGVRGRKELQTFDQHSAHERRKASEASSVDTLPLYDENRSPAYEEMTVAGSPSSSMRLAQRPHMPRSWSTQLMISTSGLGAALNDTSLKSLKFCLSILSRANRHVRDLMEALKRVLEDYRRSTSLEPSQRRSASEKDGDAMDVDQPQREDNPAAEVIAQRIKQLNEEIWNTFKTVVNTVSKYTGGALPENASVIVRWQLMSVPQRWRRAVSRSTPGQEVDPESRGDEPVGSANRMLAFGVEGLEMMDQVGGVVDSTICSAERWLDSMGRGKDGQDVGGSEQALMSEKSANGPGQ